MVNPTIMINRVKSALMIFPKRSILSTILFSFLFSSGSYANARDIRVLGKGLPDKVEGIYERAYWYDGAMGWRPKHRGDRRHYHHKFNSFKGGNDIIYVKLLSIKNWDEPFKARQNLKNASIYIYDYQYDCAKRLIGLQQREAFRYDEYNQSKTRKDSTTLFDVDKHNGEPFEWDSDQKAYKLSAGYNSVKIDGQTMWFKPKYYREKIYMKPVVTDSYGESQLRAACQQFN